MLHFEEKFESNIMFLVPQMTNIAFNISLEHVSVKIGLSSQ